MKHTSQLSDRLAKALKEVEALKQENAKLNKKLATLQIKTLHKDIPQAPSPKKSSASTNTSFHFAKSTASSRNKKTQKLQSSSSSKENTHSIRATYTSPYTDRKYTYKDGVPIPDTWYAWERPHYMLETELVSQRELEKRLERFERKRRQEEVMKHRISKSLPSPPASEQTCVEDQPWDEGWDGDPYADARKKAEAYLEDLVIVPHEELAEKSGLHRDDKFEREYVGIDSKKGLGYLQKAFEIVQEAVFEVGKTGAPGWGLFVDGPHLVRLGRNELLSWMGEYPDPCMGRNGSTAYQIRRALLDVVPLRNAISHPSSGYFRSPRRIEALLKSAQEVAVILVDERRAFELRKLRDELCDEANRSVQDIVDLYHLTLQPHGPKLQFKYHHEAMFIDIIHSRYNIYYDEQVQAIASVWANQEDRDDAWERSVYRDGP